MRVLISSFLVFYLLSSCASNHQHISGTNLPAGDVKGKIISGSAVASVSDNIRAIGLQTNIWERPQQAERERTFDALHYRIELEFDLDNKSFFGSNTVSLKPLLGSFGQLNLDAREIIITKVLNGEGDKLEYSQDDESVSINLLKLYNADEELSVKVFYQGSDLSDGLFFHDSTDSYPKMVESNSWPDHARYWFPCYDFPNDKATHEVIVTVKKPFKVVSNGELVNLIEDEDYNTYHWHQKKPHSTYLSMLSIAPFSVIKDSLGDLPVNYWVFKGDEENALRQFSGTPEIIEFFSRIYDYEYPWSKYDQVIGPKQGGGAEATSATILGLGVIHDPDPDKDANWNRIIAHEIAHQWWGDLITLRTWSEAWMNEGFGTYSDYLYTEYFRGEIEASLEIKRKKEAYLREANNRYKRPIVFTRYNRPQDNFDSHTYPKAASVLHMLRSMIGDEAFFKVLSHFLHKHEFGVVDTHDFMISVKESIGKNLDWFFNQWIYKPGHPVFEISKKWNKETGELKLRIVQIQDTVNGVPVFIMPVIIGLYKEGEEPLVEGLWLDDRVKEFSWYLPAKPDMVRFDEGNILLKEWTYKKEFNELAFQITNDDAIGRIWAIEQLDNVFENKLSDEARGLLEDLVVKDPVWAVRLAALDCLYSMNGEIDPDILEIAIKDDNHKVRSLAKSKYK